MEDLNLSYSQAEGINRIELLQVFSMYVGMISELGADAQITKEEAALFFGVNERIKMIAAKDMRVKMLISSFYDYISYTKGVKEGEMYVDLPSLQNSRKIFDLVLHILNKPEMDDTKDGFIGYVTLHKNDPLPVKIREAIDIYHDAYFEPEDAAECQFVLWLTASLSLQLADITKNYLTFCVFGKQLPRPEMKNL